jgi:ribosomal-protein-serine acetyltransferase
MIIKVNPLIQLELITKIHAEVIFKLVNENRAYLKEWLTFVDSFKTLHDAKNFVLGSIQRNEQEIDFAFVIRYENEIVGRIGIYKIHASNKIGEIGYWLSEKSQGKGIILASCVSIIDFCFFYLKLNRIEIKCGTLNFKSKAIPQKLNFYKEGILRQAEFLNDKFIDLELYSLINSDSKP